MSAAVLFRRRLARLNRPLGELFRPFACFSWFFKASRGTFNSRGLFLGEIHKLGAIGRCFKPRFFFASFHRIYSLFSSAFRLNFYLGLLLLAVFLFCPLLSRADADWKNLSTGRFIVFFKPGYELQARLALSNLEHYRPMAEKLTGNQEPPLTAFIIQDMGTSTNGLTDPANGIIQLFTFDAPSRDLPGENWWADVCPHEYVHRLHLSRREGVPGFLAGLGGNLFNPNLLLPDWIIEGIAVFGESQVSPYSGRLNDGFYDAYFAVCAKEGRFPSLLRANFAPLEYPTDIMYEAGGEFHRYLADTYGKEKFADFYGDTSGNLLSYLSPFLPCLALDAAAGKSFGGKSLPALWKDWEEELKKSKGNFEPDGERLTRRGWHQRFLQAANGRLYYERSSPVKTGTYSSFTFEEIVELEPDGEKERVLVSTTSGISAPIRVHDNRLYYSTYEWKGGYANTLTYGVESRLRVMDLASGRDRLLFEGPLRTFGLLPDGRILLSVDRRDGFGSDLSVLDPASGRPKRLFLLDRLVDEIVADENRIVVTAKKEWGQYNLFELDMEKGALTPVLPSPFLERNPQLTDNKLIFNANFNRQYRVYEYDFDGQKLSRLTSTGYAAWPAADEASGRLYFVGLNPEGFDLYRRRVEPKEIELPGDPASPAPEINLEEAEVRTGGYWENLAWLPPKALHFPVGRFDSDRSWLGLGLVGCDALNQFTYAALPAYDFKNNRMAVDFAVSDLFLAPWVWAVEYTQIENRELFIQTAYPFLMRVSPGMTTLTAGCAFDSGDGFNKAEISPFVFTAYTFPLTRFSAWLAVPLERKSFYSDLDRTGAYVYVQVRQYLPSSELRLGGVYIRDAQNTDSVFPTLRGYSDCLGGSEGWAASADYSIPLLKIHWGLWNPSFYFEDLVFDAFTDGARDSLGNSQWSYGAELHLEAKFFNTWTGLPGDLGLRVSRTKEGENTFEVLLNFGLGFYFLDGPEQTPLESGAWKKPRGMPLFDRMRRAVGRSGESPR
jgi:hypothetical protein